MEKGLDKILENKGYQKLYFRIVVALIILTGALIVFFTYYFFFYYKPCQDSYCFSSSLEKCKRVAYVREDSEAAWYYRIQGKKSPDSCNVEVMLIKMKEGTLDIEVLQGLKMTCEVNREEKGYPEKDISKCSGILKEKMQEIIIERLHSYILENLKDIKQGFNSNFTGF